MKFFAIFLFFLTPSFAAFAWEQSYKEFRAVKLEGLVQAWLPWQAQWRTISQGEILWEGTLLQASAGSKMVFVSTSTSERKKSTDDVVSITVNIPTMIRLYGRLARTVKLSSFFMSDRGEAPPKTPKQPTKPPIIEFHKAWERITGVYAKSKDKATEKFESYFTYKRQPEAVANMGLNPIRIELPKDGTLLVVDKFPTYLPLHWDREAFQEKKSSLYNIYLWDMGGERDLPTLITSENQATLMIKNEGTYLLQISSKDQTRLSPVLHFSVELSR